MTPEQLTFSALERRIEKIPEHPSYRVSPSRRARWGNGIGFAAALLALTLGKVLPASFTAVIATYVLLAVEITAFAIAWTAGLPTFNLRPSTERQEFAETLDFDLSHHVELVSWLQRFPREQLARMSAYSAHRLDRMRSKLPLLTGSIEKLGVLPLIGGLFLQLKGLHWPPQLHWPQILLIAFLMLCYWMGMLLLSLRFRLELYDTLLKRALTAQVSNDHRDPIALGSKQLQESAL